MSALILTVKPSAADLTAETFGRLSTTVARTPTAITAASGAVDGIFTRDAEYDDLADCGLQVSGEATLIVDGDGTAIAAGDGLKPTTSGHGILAGHGEPIGAIALDPATTANAVIGVIVTPRRAASYPVVTETDDGASPSVSAAEIMRSSRYEITCSRAAGAVALAIPGAASVQAGALLLVKRTGNASAITITPASGTIDDGATHATLDAIGDWALFEANPSQSEWFVVDSDIA